MDLLIERKGFERPERIGRTKGSGPFLHADREDPDSNVYDGEMRD